MLPLSPVPVSAPPRVRDMVAQAPDGPVRAVHRGPQAVYVEVSGRCVGVLAAGAVAVPCGLRSRLRSLLALAPSSAYLESGVLHIGGRPLPVGRTVDVHVPRFDRERISGDTASSATGPATPPAAVVEFVATHAPDGVDVPAVNRLVGRGDGLTPLGDDVLCGWLATARALGVATPAVDAAVRDAAPATTLLSATLLDCALHGEVVPAFGTWLARPRRPEAVAALLAVGATSGAGLLAGATLALRQLTDQEAHAA